MATPFHLPVTAAQVGTYFVGQYYQVLQHQPEFVHQFYSDASTMLRIDGNTRETASAMLQIHSLVMSLNYTGIEIKSAHSLESWNGGVLVMVSGSVHIKDLNGRRKFMQTFFLAPQEKGYFVLNDIFHFVDEEHVLRHPVAYLTQSNLDSKLNTSTIIREQVSNYMLGREIQAREFVSGDVQEIVPSDNYSFPDQRVQHVPEAEKVLEDNSGIQANGSPQNTMNPVQDHVSVPFEEPVGDPPKHTYASVLQVAKGQQTQPSGSLQHSVNKMTPASEWHNIPEPPAQQSTALPTAFERSFSEAAEDFSTLEDEGEIKSVYVRNLPSSVSASEVEEEFKKFGKLSLDGVAIRNRKDIGVCYAFVEFQDISGVQNAVKASTVQVAGHQVYIEERRANRNSLCRGGRRGRSRGSYHTEAPRGRFGGRGFGRGSNQDGNEREYNRLRGNGYYWQAPRQDRGFSGNHVSRNGQHTSD